MKTLTLMRHAKSCWEDPCLEDFDRPLNGRGKRDAPRMGQAFTVENFSLDRIITSEAARARETADLFCKGFCQASGEKSLSIFHDARLYLSSSDTIFEVVSQQDDALHHLLIVAHNPGISRAASRLTNQDLDDSPTGFVVRAEFDIHSWSELPEALPGIPKWIANPKSL